MPRIINSLLNRETGNTWIEAQEIEIVRPLENDRYLVRLLEFDQRSLTIVHESNIEE